MKYLIVLLFALTSGCGNYTVAVFPEMKEMPDATVNKQYQTNIEITGGAVNESSVSVNIMPVDSGLMWKPHEVKYNFAGEKSVNRDYHKITIYGIPNKLGVYNVVVSGFILGTMSSGKDFYKEYTIKVDEDSVPLP